MLLGELQHWNVDFIFSHAAQMQELSITNLMQLKQNLYSRIKLQLSVTWCSVIAAKSFTTSV